MAKAMSGYQCQNCKKVLGAEERPCPDCGCEVRDINVVISEEIKVRTSLGLKKYGQGSKKFLTHLKQGWFPSKNTTEHPEGVQLIQSVDRENNLYTKNVVDERTGSIVKDLKEPLDQHIQNQKIKPT